MLIDITFTITNYTLYAIAFLIIGIIPVLLAIRLGIKKRRQEVLSVPDDPSDSITDDLDEKVEVFYEWKGKTLRINMKREEAMEWDNMSRQQRRAHVASMWAVQGKKATAEAEAGGVHAQ